MEPHEPSVIRPRFLSWGQFFAFLFIGGIALVIASVPAKKLLAFANLSLWSNPNLEATDTEISAAVVWLVMANMSSIVAVSLLWKELRAVVKAAQGLHFKRKHDPPRFAAKIPKSFENGDLPNYVLAPLFWISCISMFVLIVTILLIAALIVVLLHGKPLNESVFFLVIIWTGFLYVLAMTICDFAARRSYCRLCAFELDIPSDNGFGNEYNDRAHRHHRELLEALGDFNRMIFYVDMPVLIGAGIIVIHKFAVLEPGAYYFGFIAGTVAMHTILANTISLIIAATSTASPNQTI